MAGKPPILSSRSFKGQKALVGKQFRTGALGRALNDIYGDIDTAFANLEAEITGLDWKNSVKVASTGNLTLSGTQTIDGVAAGVGDRVLVKDQSTASENGIYVVAAAAWSRAEDANADAEVTSQLVVSVDQGTVNADTTWRQTAEAPTVGTDAITFAPFGPGTSSTGTESLVHAAAAQTAGSVTLNTQKGSISIDQTTNAAAKIEAAAVYILTVTCAAAKATSAIAVSTSSDKLQCVVQGVANGSFKIACQANAEEAADFILNYAIL